jgi:plasmid stabilization system protein ParE
MILRYDARAIADISEIYLFIAAHDPMAASRVVARIRVLCEQLADRPLLGRRTSQPRIRVRPVVRYPYLIFYTCPDQ